MGVVGSVIFRVVMRPVFQPAPGFRNPHAQTIGARLLRSRRGVSFRRERIETPDGDFLDLDWALVAGAPTPSPPAPLCLVLHGLEGSARSKYAIETYRQLARRGLEGVGLNFRACSGELNRTARMYHSGETGDLRFVLRLLRARSPARTIHAIGFSLGGNVLVKYLGEEGAARDDSGGVARAAVISVPYDLAAGAAHLEHGLARLYVWRLLHTLKRKLRAKAPLVRDRVDLQSALRARTFRAFDDAATAPLHGFAGADDYYRRSSSGPFLPHVRVPLRLIHAEDDPFLPAGAMPREVAAANHHVDACFERHGGHVGFVAGSLVNPTFWGEQTAVEWIAGEGGAP